MRNILIYTEGGLYLGLGNIYRMLELAKSLIESDSELCITFVTSSENYIIELIRSKGFDALQTKNNDIADLIGKQEFNILIVDKINIEDDFILNIRKNIKRPFKTVIFGSISTANKYADLVVNAVIGTNFTNVEFTDEYGTKYMCGPRYITLRSEFKSNSYQKQKKIMNILLLFGGADQANYSCLVLTDLLKSDKQYRITVVIGRGYMYINELEKISSNNDNITILRNIDNVSEVMNENDFLITSPGTTLFESMYIGLPYLALFQNDSQKMVFRNFYNTKSYESINNIDEYINDIFNNYLTFKKDIAQFSIAQGKNDIINSLIYLL